MDLIKMGTFISEIRKQKGLTQKELAEKLHLSNRTISKWECGKGIPDSSIMIALCEILEISVNELLSGEHLSNDNYIAKADANIIALIEEPKTTYKRELIRSLQNILTELLLFLFIIFCIYLNVMHGVEVMDYIDFPAFLTVFGTIGVILVATGLYKDFFTALRICMFSCSGISKEELNRALLSVLITVLASFFSGTILSIASTVCTFISTSPENQGALLVALAVAWLGFLYALAFNLLMVPVIGRILKIKIRKSEEELP